jgi:hypothetical protein
MTLAGLVRCVLATVWVAPLMVAPAYLFFTGQAPIDPDSPCNFGQCGGTGRHDPWLFLLLLFPPTWGSVIILHLRESRNLSWGQYLIASVLSFLAVQLFNGVWTVFLGNFTLQQLVIIGPWHPLTWLMLVVTVQGYGILWFAAYEALRFLPRPLGIGGRLEWDRPAPG